MNKFIFGFLILFISSSAYAESDQIVLDAGLGIFNTEGSNLSQVKFAKIGLQEDLWYNLKHRFNAGAWLDSRGEGYTNSGFAGYQMGFQVDNQVFEGSIFFGPSFITSQDTALGGPMQFNASIFFGIKDNGGNTIGFSYNHFSSGGIEMPNLGRDFGGLEIKF